MLPERFGRRNRLDPWAQSRRRDLPTPLSWERHHSDPQLLLATDFDIVLTHQRQAAIGSDPEDGQPGGHMTDGIAFTHQHIDHRGRDQQAPAGIDAEGAHMESLWVGMLDRRGLAAGRVDRKHRDVVLTTAEDLLAVEIYRSTGAIRDVNGVAMRMHVDRAAQYRLWELALVIADGRTLDVAGLRRKGVAQSVVHVQLVLPFERHIYPRLAGVKVKMARPVAKAAPAADLNIGERRQ